jgi:hypothetical protein
MGDTHSFIDNYFAIFVSPVWVGGYLLFWCGRYPRLEYLAGRILDTDGCRKGARE